MAIYGYIRVSTMAQAKLHRNRFTVLLYTQNTIIVLPNSILKNFFVAGINW